MSFRVPTVSPMQKLTRQNWRLRPLQNCFPYTCCLNRLLAILAVISAMVSAGNTFGADTNSIPSDPLLDLMLKKGLITEDEAAKVKAEAEALRTNVPAAPPIAESTWKINKAIKSVELFGDLRVRYENRQAISSGDDQIDLQRGRYSVRIGIRGEALDNFYYGVRLDTSANPRSSWVTFGTSTSGNPYQGPYGKSTAGIFVGQVYIGWHPASWLDMTVGKMPMPLYTTAMVWDSDYNPEGAAEHLKYSVGQADFFANFGQFIYQDVNPNYASGGLGINGAQGQNGRNIFQFAWQGGLTYHFNTNTFAKVAATFYDYVNVGSNNISPFFGGPFVGEGAFTGVGTPNPVNGASGYGTSGPNSLGFPNNQVGINNLGVLELPAEFDFKISKCDAKLFGDFAYNLDGAERARQAQAAYANYLTLNGATFTAFPAQTKDVKAGQVGMAVASPGCLGMVYGQTSKKNGWEVRSYWQHVEQYALDPNLLDSDFFEGRGNLQGFYAAVAYGLGANVIGTVRGGHANRINDQLGTGGSKQDIPQINPIEHFKLLQVDLTLRF